MEISDLPKDKAALVHYKSLGKGICIYTDASAIPDNASTGIGVGLAVYLPDNSQSTQSRSNLGLYQLVYNRELEGITQAVEYTSKIAQPGQVYQIYSDNQAALLRLKTPSDFPGQACQIQASEATKLAISKGASISLY